MANYTENLNLEKPLQSEGYDVDVFNANFQKIDDFAGLTPPRALTADKLTTGAKINGVNFKGDADIISGLGLYSDTNTYNNTNIVYLYDDDEKLRIFQSIQNDNIGHNPLTSSSYWQEIKLGAKRNYGQIITSSLPIINDDTLHLANGSLLSQQNYPELLNYINSIYATTKDWTTPEDKLSEINWTSIAYGNNKYIAINGNGYVATSTDANTWSSPTQKISNTSLNCIIYDGSKFITLDKKGDLTASSDGNTWNQITNLGNRDWNALIYANSLYIALGETGYISTSSDGINWSTPTQPISDYNWNALAYDGNNYIALGKRGYISTSSDGSNWSTATNPVNLYNTNFNWKSLAYDGTQFIALEDSGTVCTSTNGINWNTPQTTILNGTPGWRSLSNTTNGLVALSVSGYIGMQIDSPIAPFTTEENWQATYTTYGECGKYVYNSSNNTVRIPLYNSYFTNTVNSQILGDLTEASLPNIKGSFNHETTGGTATGAFSIGSSVAGQNASPAGDTDHLIEFNASDYNSIYKDTATTVNTQSTKQLVYIVVKV